MATGDDIYSEVLSSGPSQGTLVLVLSKMKEEGRLVKVIQESLKALKVYPKDIHIRQLLAEAYLEAGLVSQAEDELRTVTNQIGDLVASYKLQAQVYRKQRRREEAIEALTLYLAHRPHDQAALDLLEDLKSMEQGVGAETASQEEDLPKIATSTLAEIYLSQGQIQEAIDTLEKVVAQNPEDEGSRKRLKELKAIILKETAIEDTEMGHRQKKQRMIKILETWLANIRSKLKFPLSA